MLATSPSQTLSLQEFLALPETKPAQEYINGQIFTKPMPQGKHSLLQGQLLAFINQMTTSQHQALALPELRCTFGERSIVPDIAVFCWDRLPLDSNGDIANSFLAAPDWTIEILSPEQNQSRVTANILHCLSHGSQMGWLIDPQAKSVLVYPAGQQPLFFAEPASGLSFPSFLDQASLSIEALFTWLKPQRL